MSDPVDQIVFEKGVDVIRREIDARLAQFKIQGADVRLKAQGPSSPVIFEIGLGGKVEQAEFSIEEIQDSAQAIDHPASSKVGHLVSHFVG